MPVIGIKRGSSILNSLISQKRDLVYFRIRSSNNERKALFLFIILFQCPIRIIAHPYFRVMGRGEFSLMVENEHGID